MPSLFHELGEAAAKRGVRFLVIGGHAVIEHGYQRGTEDADILVSKSERKVWEEIVANCGYILFHDGGVFAQFKPDGSRGQDQWDLDMMLVSAEVFARLLAAAEPARIEGAAVVIPSLEHLIALKAHALKNGKGLRVLKDMTDVAELLSPGGSIRIRRGCRSFLRNTAILNLMNESLNSLRETPEGPALEFPDWSGQLAHDSRGPNDRWLEYCRSNLAKLRAHPGYSERRRRNGIPVEFVL